MEEKDNKFNILSASELKKRWELMLSTHSSDRTIEEVIEDLTAIIKDFKRDSFLPLLTHLKTQIHLRHTSDIFQNLLSPMRQFVYLIDLYLSINSKGTKEISKDSWNEVTHLLNEIELIYFVNIGFFHQDVNENLDKVIVSLQTFFNHFANGQISYNEQTIERLERHCKIFDTEVEKEFGFVISDALEFSYFLKKLIDKKYNEALYYLLHPDEWKRLTDNFIERGLDNPKDWTEQPELIPFRKYIETPSLIYLHKFKDIYELNLSNDKITNLIKFLLYDEDQKNESLLYYADKSPFLETPLIRLNDEYYLCPNYKFLLESFYNRINSRLSKIKKEKYTQSKNLILEDKTSEVFRKLFGKEALIFRSYYVDAKKSEQDIFIYFKGFCFIIEVKDSTMRPPMRNPVKAFEKIKSDFRKSIQSAYNQCLRVESFFELNSVFPIYSAKNGKILYEVYPDKINEYFTIIVTQQKYGNIQTNLGSLLEKNTEALYPWSVCIDDLEAFILVLKKLKKGRARSSFINYLKYRESFHEHVFCGDELELCGYFLNSPRDFENTSIIDEDIHIDPRMSEIFDAEYQNGLGFKNEIDIDKKRNQAVPKYEKNWKLEIISGRDIIH